jgi:HD superfamily phosphohydrolase
LAGPALPNITGYPEELAAIRDILANRYVFIGTIDEGKTGIAYRLGLFTNRDHAVCLKTIRPTIKDGAQRATVADTLKKEVEILSKLRHRSLPAILEDGTSAQQPYYVCTFHPGSPCAKVRETGRSLTVGEAFFVISEFVSVISHVHSAGRTHCDLHGGNILLGDDIFRDGILIIDFGSGHRESDSSPLTANRGNPGFKPQDSLRLDRLSVERESLEISFRRADIAALGKLLTQMDGVFVKNASPLVRDEYRRFCRDLQNNQLDEWTAIADRVATVFDPLRCLGENADLFLFGDARRETITIPVVGTVGVGSSSLAVINTAEFQRLRSLKQLSFCDWNFPGATHTRFEHALGVFALAWESMNHLAYNRHFRSRFDSVAVRGFLLASLLHDIGHYPFAHAVEQYAASRFQGDENGDVRRTASHEKYTLQLITADSPFQQLLLKDWGEAATTLAIRILEGKVGALSRLLDGPLDIDKMDYLTRDAYHAGLYFGGGLNPRKLCGALDCDQDGADVHARSEHLAAVEGFVMLQDQLYGALYWHPAVRGVHAMFQAIIAHIVAKDSQKLEKLVAGLRNSETEVEAVRNVIIPQLEASEHVHRDKGSGVNALLNKLTNIAKRIAVPDYSSLYQVAQTYNYNDPDPKKAPTNVYRTILETQSGTGSLNQINWDKILRLRRSYLNQLRRKLSNVSDVDVLIDVPYGKGAKRHVSILFPDRAEPVRLDEVTHLKRTAFDQPVHFWSPIRVFLAPQHAEKIEMFVESVRQGAEEEYFHGDNSDTTPLL